MTNPTITGRPGADAPETPDPLSPSRPADADRKPKWLDRRAQAKYLEDEHGLRVSPRRLTNLAWEGSGPEERFFGRTPLSTPQWLDAWVQSRIKDKSRRRISHPCHTSGDNDQDASTPESAADCGRGDADGHRGRMSTTQQPWQDASGCSDDAAVNTEHGRDPETFSAHEPVSDAGESECLPNSEWADPQVTEHPSQVVPPLHDRTKRYCRSESLAWATSDRVVIDEGSK